MSTPVVVFDTNVLFSAIGWSGNPRRCLDFARSGKIDAVTCEPIIEELSQKLLKKLSFSETQVLEIVEYLFGCIRVVAIAGNLKGASLDPKDDMILECAIAAKASHIVSGDKKHLLSMQQFQGITILSPAALVALVGSQ